ncbi:hypothetical protein GE061_006723 [Apolygus lucorum]|uniref:Uncharacterized protein n=1 Tax=Apolygus lucorum TaxID=248454 RepID=A0A6A4JX60_APOLU|nr:hypothetical protein GE061_006723 [Apolygus lucorum]
MSVIEKIRRYYQWYKRARRGYRQVRSVSNRVRKTLDMIRMKQAPKDVADEEKRLARKVVLNSVFCFCCAVALIRATPYLLTKV